MKGCLVLGRPKDPHVVALRDELPKHGLDPRELDPRRFPSREPLSIHLAKGHKLRIATPLADFDDVRVGWFRSQDTVKLSGDVARGARRFARAAALAGYASLRAAMRFPWVNDPHRALRAGDKFWQLLVARDRGLAVPETLLSSDPAEFRAFVTRLKRVAVKSPSGSAGLPDDQRVLTQLVTPRDLADAETVRFAPVLAQAYVEKQTEVRATLVDGETFAVEIHSQDTPKTRVDWRRYDPRVRYERIALPARVRRACVAVAEDCELDYSGIDLVRTPRDEYVFLEINSEPAWLWVEDETGLPITRAIAKLLARRARERVRQNAPPRRSWTP